MYDFKKVENEVSGFWKKKKTEEETLKANPKKKIFSFLDGPPTANAPPALHHLEVRTYKDVINRFKFMRGFSVPRKAGWDCHGLPVEVQIEKKLKLNSKKEILNYGEAKFIKEAKKSVFEYIEAWNKSTEKLAYWVDLKNPYITLDNRYIESVWWSLKELYNKKLLYEDYKVVPFCPRCETPLSSHEVALGYKKTTEDSVVAKFKIKGRNEYFLVWTTTPWTLPSNLAIAVNPGIDYVYVKENETYVVAKDLAKNFFDNPKILKTVKGKQLIGMKYEPLMPYFRDKDAFVVIAGNFVTIADGTGIVHMAPAFGEDDYEAIKKNKLPFVKPVNSNGKFTSEVKDYEGKFIKSADKEIINDLKNKNKIFKVIKYEHDYPFCWRCSTPLMYYAIDSWFIKVTAYKKRLIELNEKINWVPSNIKEGRFGEWLRNVKDWALSRNKFWGTPIPVWRCASCKHEEIVGSIKELKEKSIRKLSDKEIDLHKPWIDSVKLKCAKCKKEMSRVLEVIDCWYDSGAASFAQFHYPFENKGIFKKRFPYDFISEAIDQTRGWFYTLHVLSTILFDDIAYKNVICAGHIVDEKGEKMSKSKGNILNPDEIIDAVGVDAVRMQFCTTDVGDSKMFGINKVKQEVLPFLNILWNTSQFYKQFNANERAKINIEDKWILSRLNSTIKETTEALEKYKIEDGLKPIMNFVVNDFSRTYIKLIRERQDKNVVKVVEECINSVCKMLAPYTPYITEKIYSDMNKKSVHLSGWPKADGKKIDRTLERRFDFVLKIIENGLKERDKAQIGLRWPLKHAKIVAHVTPEFKGGLRKELDDIIKNQLNIKSLELEWLSVLDRNALVEVKLDTRTTPELEAEGYAREMSRQVQDFRKNLGLKKEDVIELAIFADEELAKVLRSQEKFLKNRTNSKKIIFFTDGFENSKEIFKNAVDFKIKDKRGKIATNW
ncbi:isoleucine--tRNA ligase [Candidatus Pacearchaeota archaeon]|nr:isoleucine--tRNA ligase [Candidatus Pacearchaeota archaeon]